jgi:hypothetical protein
VRCNVLLDLLSSADETTVQLAYETLKFAMTLKRRRFPVSASRNPLIQFILKLAEFLTIILPHISNPYC